MPDEAIFGRKALKLYAAIACAYWLPQAFFARRVIRELPRLADMPPHQERAHWPTVSVIMTALNEEDTIEAAVRSRLAEDYPALELILVDDRSTDSTGAIADRLAEQDERLKVIHLDTLPEGWVGKVHAMYRGALAATGAWLLFSDADVHVGVDTLRRAVAFAEADGVGHLGVFPEFLLASFLLDSVLSSFTRLLLIGGRVWSVSDPRSGAAAGVGSFNLVRRDALAATEGLEWLKMEVGDDVALGQMLKAAGVRQQLASGNGLLSVQFYPTIPAALTGSERAMFTALGGCSLARCVALGLGLAALELAPVVLTLRRGGGRIRGVGLLLLGVQIGVTAALNRWSGRPPGQAALAPLAGVAIAFLSVRAGVLGKVRGGIYWRGTFYPTAQLKAGRRFRP